MSRKRIDTYALDAFLEEVASADPEALDELAALGETLPAQLPSEALRARVLDSARHEGRFSDHGDHIAALLDLPRERADVLLDGIAEPKRWGPGPVPGVSLYHVEGGAAVRDAITGFVRVEPGTTFPMHSHLGPETVLILQGACLDSHGTRLVAGDESRMATGTAHSFEVPADGMPLLFLAVVQTGLEMFGQKLLPQDPGA